MTSQDVVEHVSVISDWSAAEERALVRKLDFRVLLPCCIVYFLAYLDRANMGFVAVLQSGTKDNMLVGLDLVGTRFSWSVSITYFLVTVLLLPSNLVMKKVSGKRYFPAIMVLFGAVVCCMAAVPNYASLLATRFFLGVPEAGVVPACIMYFSFWYKPSERGLRIGIFHAANALASGVGGFLAVGVDNVSCTISKCIDSSTNMSNQLNGKGGLESWRWIFIIEGLMPIFMAIPVYFLLLTFPETSTALSEREQYIAINRFPRGATRETDKTWDTRAFLDIMSRPSTYVFFVSYLCLLIVAVALGTFLPIILHNVSSHIIYAYCRLTCPSSSNSRAPAPTYTPQRFIWSSLAATPYGPGTQIGPESECGTTCYLSWQLSHASRSGLMLLPSKVLGVSSPSHYTGLHSWAILSPFRSQQL